MIEYSNSIRCVAGTYLYGNVFSAEASVVLGSGAWSWVTSKFYKQDHVGDRPEGGVGDRHQVTGKEHKPDIEGTSAVCVCVHWDLKCTSAWCTRYSTSVSHISVTYILPCAISFLYTASVTRLREEPQETGHDQWGDWEENEVS